jgi:adenine/guanine phosphoribosyltransferase-like PRPP-binding protein
VVQLDGTTRDQPRQIDRLVRRPAQFHDLGQVFFLTPLHDRPLVDPLDVIEQQIDELVGETTGIGGAHARGIVLAAAAGRRWDRRARAFATRARRGLTVHGSRRRGRRLRRRA